jgi:Rv0078B-related antitoxin
MLVSAVDRATTPAEKLRIALDLADLAQRMMLQRLRRLHPHETESEVLDRLQRWMRTRPGAEHGDCEGRLIPWPRRRS